MPALTPQAYVYLRHPILSSGETMLYHTFQHLCFTGGLRVHVEEAVIGRGRPRTVRRLFLTRDPDHTTSSAADAYALDFFAKGEALNLGQLRQRVELKVKDYERFKYEQMLTDLKRDGLIAGRHWRTSAGRKACRLTRDLLFTVQHDIGRRLDGGWQRSFPHVQALGSGMVLLNEATRDALKAESPRKSDLVAVFSILTYFETASASSGIDAYVSGMGAYGGGSGGGGGFGGFGGGSFGGGGAGGSW